LRGVNVLSALVWVKKEVIVVAEATVVVVAIAVVVVVVVVGLVCLQGCQLLRLFAPF
jgi:hypothetical protein